MPKTRSAAALYLFLVFASGILVGTISNRLYMTRTASANTSPQTMAEFRKRYLSEMRTHVKVNDAQVAAVTKLLDETKRKFDDLHAQEQPLHDKIQQDLIDSIRACLTDEQKPAYDAWRIERERERARINAQNPKR
jgi:hypothetical protein